MPKPDTFVDDFLRPAWKLPATVEMAITTRCGGFSPPPFDSLNLGMHVGDDPALVAKNQQHIKDRLDLPSDPVWLDQQHQTTVLQIHKDDCFDKLPAADAAISLDPGVVCVVTVADCVPVLLCDKAGTRVAAVHAGWRGLSAGVLEKTIDALQCDGDTLCAWIGPGIGPDAFEVGDDVRDQFVAKEESWGEYFLPDGQGLWKGDLFSLVRATLQETGVREIYGGMHCTYYDQTHFFSYRRQPTTGRIAALAWLTA